MLNQLYLLQLLVHKVEKWCGSCCVLVGPECWGPLHGERAQSVIKSFKCQRSIMDSFKLTL